MVRELGLERRETVRLLSSIDLLNLWNIFFIREDRKMYLTGI